MRMFGEIFLVLNAMVTLATPSQEQSYGPTYGSQQGSKPITSVSQEKIDEDEVVRVTTTLVTIPVTVSDRDGKYIGNLRREDFRIFEDGVEQQVTFFSSTEQPLSIILLLDTSASTELYLDLIKEAASAFIEQMRPHDTVLPVSFDGQVRSLVSKGSGDPVLLQVAVHSMRADIKNTGTRLYDAVDAAMHALRNATGRKAIILFTDGEDTGSAVTREKTLEKATELDALVYSIYLDTTAAYDNLPNLNRELKMIRHSTPSAQYLKVLAKKTGGRLYEAKSLKMLREAFVATAEELRHQYNVSYYPKSQAGDRRLRQVTVKVKRQNISVHGRKTFVFAPPNTQ